MSLLLKWKKLIEEIKSKWFEAYIVWWAVRDLLLDREPHDVDIATNMPVALLETNYKTNNIGKGKDFWLLVLEFEWNSFEIAQFRWDWEYFNWRRPESINLVKTIEEDLARRDFTVNAMAYDWKNIIDLFWWQEDLKNRIIRFVWDPQERVKEDHLRILRAFRFWAKLSEMPNELNWFKNINAKIDTKSMDAIVNNSHLLKDISWERITEEIIKIASLWWEKFANFLQVTEQFWVLEEILRPIHKSYYFQHNFDEHPEWQEPTGMNRVFSHIVESIRCYDWYDPIAILCILFHDIGKTFTYSFEYDDKKKHEPDRHMYRWHEVIWEKFFRSYANFPLRLCWDLVDTVSYCIRNHTKRRDIPNMDKKSIYDIVGNKDYNYLEDVVTCNIKSTLCENNLDVKFYLLENWSINNLDKLNEIKEIVNNIKKELWTREEFSKYAKTIFTWHDIVSEFWQQWKWMKKLIHLGVEWIINHWINNKKDLLQYIKNEKSARN